MVNGYASQIVKRVFREYLSGKTIASIASGLRKDKILTPANYKKKLGISNYRVLESDPYYWKSQMICQMLEKEEYTGATTINLKTAKISYKQRGCKLLPRLDWLIFPDTHEAIISQEDFEMARKMLDHKRGKRKNHWKNTAGHENLFAGLVFCENRHKLSFSHNKRTTSIDHYKCYHYRRAGDTCSGSHYLRKEILEELVLRDLQQLISSVQLDEEKLLERLKSRFDIQENQKQDKLRRQLSHSQKRTQELDVIIQKLYEKQLLDEISDERFRKLADSYESEQAELN